MESAEALFQQVLRNFGLPEDIISDRGPQFISRVWKSFFNLLGVSVSFLFRNHPQTIGQTEPKIQSLSEVILPQSAAQLEPLPSLG